MDRFWARNKNKELIKVSSRNCFVGLASKQGITVALSGYVDDGYGAYPCVKVQERNTEPCEGLKLLLNKKTKESFLT